MTHAEILRAMTGLMAALFTALISSTIVSTALPTIIGALHGTQRQYTWVITASLLATTVTTPIWGKLADLFSKKVLVQASIVVFVVGSIAAGLSESVPFLIACRVVQGIGMGGLTALAQAIMGAIVAPRQRGRYSGYLGAVMAVSTVSGPLLGGVIVDHLGWRWTFYVCVPLAVIALFVLQAQLHLPTVKRAVSIDYWGAVLITVTASLPLLWVTFAGTDFDWVSGQSALYLGATLLGAVLFVLVENRAAEPLVPLHVLRNRTAALVILASVAVGISLFGAATFLGQYFQLALGKTPTTAGLLTIPLMAGSMISSIGAGQIITRTGRWKIFLVLGGLLMAGGLFALGTVDHATPVWHTQVYMGLMGLGMGALTQNLVLAVQNTVDVRDIGASSASVAFFRSLGGAIGVSALGAVLATRVQDNVVTGLSALGPQAAAAAQQGGGTGTLDLADMPAPVRAIVRAAYGDATGRIFLIAAIVAVVAFVAVLFIKEVPLRTTVSQEASSPAAVEQAVAGAAGGTAPAVAQAAIPPEAPEVDEPALSPREAEALAVSEERRTGRPSARRDTPVVIEYDARTAGSSPARRDAVAAGRHRYPRRRD
nr:MDR family MFS transporter [Lapillicoccus jejuensis]